jgi:hypothetical protein
MSSLRSTLGLVHNLHFRLFNSCVRSGPQGREGVVGFLARACELNKRRGVMRVKAREVATDGFMVNLFDTALRFSEPFMDPKYSKVRGIHFGQRVSLADRLSLDRSDRFGLLAATEALRRVDADSLERGRGGGEEVERRGRRCVLLCLPTGAAADT